MHIIILLLILNDILLTISEPQPGRRLPCRLLSDPGPPQPLTAPVYVRPPPRHLCSPLWLLDTLGAVLWDTALAFSILTFIVTDTSGP